MRKPNIVGLKKVVEEVEFPLVEITGQIDCGKKSIASLVAKRIYGTHLTFPCLSPESFTGRALLAALSAQPRDLELNPGWWFHLYAANLFEFKDTLDRLTKIMPVVVTNYLIGMRAWANSTGLDMTHFLKGFSAGLPAPVKAYSIVGEAWDSPGNFKVNFSPEYQLRVNKSLSALTDKRVTKIQMPYGLPRFDQLNTICKTISADIDSRYKTGVNAHALYSHTDFLGKNFK